MTPMQRSARSRKGWASRKRMQAARQAAPKPGALKRQRVGAQRILDATRPGVPSRIIAAELGITESYVRAIWQRTGQPKRRPGPQVLPQ